MPVPGSAILLSGVMGSRRHAPAGEPAARTWGYPQRRLRRAPSHAPQLRWTITLRAEERSRRGEEQQQRRGAEGRSRHGQFAALHGHGPACGCDLTASIPAADDDRGATVSLVANGTLSDDVPQAGDLVVAAAGLEFLPTDLSESGEVGVFITTTAPRARPSRSTRSTSASNFRPAAPGASSSRRPPPPTRSTARSPAMAKAAWSPP